ncbi:MAG: hypothetical protein V1820_01245 [archaeon]
MSKRKHFFYCASPFGPGEGPEIRNHSIERDLGELSGAKVDGPQVTDQEFLADCIEREADRKGPIDGLVLAFHGTPSAMFLCDRGYFYEELSIFNARGALSKLRPFFSEDARVLLYSCRSGGGLPFLNIATAVSKALGVEVDAPKKLLISQEAYEGNWGNQFALDSDGKLSFNYDNFRFYDRLKARWADKRGTRCCVAPLHYAEREGNTLSAGQYTADDMFLRLRKVNSLRENANFS